MGQQQGRISVRSQVQSASRISAEHNILQEKRRQLPAMREVFHVSFIAKISESI